MTMTDQTKGLLITFIGVLLVVPDSLFVRLIHSDPLVCLFSRYIDTCESGKHKPK